MFGCIVDSLILHLQAPWEWGSRTGLCSEVQIQLWCCLFLVTPPPAQGASRLEKRLWVVCTWDAFECERDVLASMPPSSQDSGH